VNEINRFVLGGVMKVAIGSDHAGFDLKQFLLKELSARNYDMIDCGTDTDDSTDYSDYARKVCDKVTSKEARLGIVICGTGIGVSMAANKIHGIRAALCHTEFSARLARQHNDANVLALGGRVLGKDLALNIAEAFLAESFSGVDRHKRRIDKMMKFENSECENE
jgi:ribose 5-phosphate isomerase B